MPSLDRLVDSLPRRQALRYRTRQNVLVAGTVCTTALVLIAMLDRAGECSHRRGGQFTRTVVNDGAAEF